jgi:hypothetical protein
MLPIGLLVVAGLLPAAAADASKKPAVPPAQVTLTAEVACLHCDYGEGDSCAVCLKLDEKTPVLLAGKVAKLLEKDRFSKKVVAATGTMTVKNGRMILTSDDAPFITDQNKDKVPGKGAARIVGPACCGSCDLKLCEECTLAIVNAASPIVLNGKLAMQHAEAGEEKVLSAEGRLFIDKRGLLRLDATKTTFSKKK